MAATPIQKIPTLTGEAAKRFIERADSTERPTLSISEQQRKCTPHSQKKQTKIIFSLWSYQVSAQGVYPAVLIGFAIHSEFLIKNK